MSEIFIFIDFFRIWHKSSVVYRFPETKMVIFKGFAIFVYLRKVREHQYQITVDMFQCVQAFLLRNKYLNVCVLRTIDTNIQAVQANPRFISLNQGKNATLCIAFLVKNTFIFEIRDAAMISRVPIRAYSMSKEGVPQIKIFFLILESVQSKCKFGRGRCLLKMMSVNKWISR